MGCQAGCCSGGKDPQAKAHHSETLALLNIGSAYAQYKADNAKIANWLGRAALNHGYPREDLLTDAQSADDDGEDVVSKVTRAGVQAAKNARKRAKAKAGRAQAVVQAASGMADGRNGIKSDSPAPTIPVSQSRPSRFTLSIDQYLSITRYIVECRVPVPADLIRLLTRCINLRDRCTVIRFDLGLQVDKGHAHFATVLDQVRDLLLPLASSTSFTPKPAKASPSSSTECSARPDLAGQNRFAHLPTVAAEDLPDIDLPEPSRMPGGARASCDAFGVQVDLGEASIRALAFFVDVHNLRDHIKGLWRDYRDGKIGLVTVAVTTNAGIGMFRATCDNFASRVVPLFHDDNNNSQAGLDSMLLTLAARFETGREARDGSDGGFDAHKPFPMISPTIQDYLLLDVKDSLWSIFAAKPHGDNVEPPNRQDRLHNAVSLPSTYSTVEAFCADTVDELLDMVMQCRPAAAMERTLVQMCEVIQCLDSCLRRGELSLYAVIGVRILVDIHLMTQPIVHRIEAENSAMIARFNAQAMHFRSAVSSMRAKFGAIGSCVIKQLDHLMEDNMTATTDWIAQLILQRGARGRTLYARHPALCGSMMFMKLSMWSQLADLVAQDRWVILSGVALYAGVTNFLRQQPNSAPLPSWPDMADLVDLHNLTELDEPTPTSVSNGSSVHFAVAWDIPKSISLTISAASTTCHGSTVPRTSKVLLRVWADRGVSSMH